MYKSSPFTFIFKYIIPVIMLSGSIYTIYDLWNASDPQMQGFAKAMLVMTIWISIFLIQMPFRLKNIEATESGILVKELGEQIEIKYSNVDWVSKFDLSSPWFVTIKYHDLESGNDKKMSFMPNQNHQRFLSDDAMTAYIRNKIRTDNPNYSKDKEPSKIKNIIIGILLSLPFTLLAFYFMNDGLNLL